MKQFPLQSPLDLGTVDIIQSEPQYKQKNSLIYKGILSNMTVQTGEGILSTSGHNLDVYIGGDSRVVQKDGDDIIYYPEYDLSVNNIDTVDKEYPILCARRIDGHNYVFIQEPSGNGTLEKDGVTVVSYNRVQCAFITSDARIVSVDARNRLYLYDIRNNTTTMLSSNIGVTIDEDTHMYCSVIGSYLIVGLDNKDVQKRVTYIYAGTTLNRTIKGFGCVHEASGLITGEPLPVEYQIGAAGQLPSDNELSFLLNGNFDYNYCVNADEVWFHRTRLSNGVHRIQPFDPNSGYLWKRKWAADGTNTKAVWSGQSWSTYVATRKAQSEDGTAEQDDYGNWISTSLMDLGTQASTDTDRTIVYVYALKVDDEGDVSVYALYGMMRCPFDAESGTQDVWNGIMVGFIDIDNPVGKVGWKSGANTSGNYEVADNDQIFPHVRHFYNDTTKKGVTYDYGPGWVKFFYSGIISRLYNRSSLTLYEFPLRQYNINVSATDPTSMAKNWNYVDFVTYNNQQSQPIKYGQHNDYAYWASSVSQPENQKTMESTHWLLLTMLSHRGGLYENFCRIHPRLSQFQEENAHWYFSHSLTGIGSNSSLVVCPFYIPIIDDLFVQYYNGLPIAVGQSFTLLDTPRDIGYNWNVTKNGDDDYSLAFWDGRSLKTYDIYVGSIYLKKIQDYVFVSNVLNDKNVFIESHDGSISPQYGFPVFAMNSYITGLTDNYYTLPTDATTYLSNDVFYYGAGINSGIKETSTVTSLLFPAITIQGYVDTNDTVAFTNNIVESRKFVVRADLGSDIAYWLIPPDTYVQEYFTHSQATTDVTYRQSYMRNVTTFEEDYKDTSWIPTSELILYPIGITSTTYGENYIISTVDTGNGYVARFYNKDNKSFLVYNEHDQVYNGSEIFTIQSGNYYFDGQGIYYLGSQSDYSQNIFTAYALGMTFLANSSSEAYFYSPWDKCIYIYTASNTVQKAFSVADRPDILDAVYSTQEQCLYILFTDGSVYIKSQLDDCLITGLDGARQLQTTATGAYVLSDTKYWIFNPKDWNDTIPLLLETEWLGDSIAVQKTSYVDVVLYSDHPVEQTVTIDVRMIQNGIVTSDTVQYTVKASDWKNQFARVRFVPTKEHLQGNAVKVIVMSDDISVFSINIEMNPISDMTIPRLRG